MEDVHSEIQVRQLNSNRERDALTKIANYTLLQVNFLCNRSVSAYCNCINTWKLSQLTQIPTQTKRQQVNTWLRHQLH